MQEARLIGTIQSIVIETKIFLEHVSEIMVETGFYVSPVRIIFFI